MKILAIDPGVMSGYCFGELRRPGSGSPNTELTLEPKQYTDDVEEIWDRVAEYQPRYIICEDFEVRRNTPTGVQLYSVQAIGVVNLYALKCEHQCTVYIQKAAQGKGYYSDKLIKEMALYKRGVPHGMDALRHLLHWITFGAGYQLIEGQDIKKIARLIT